MWRLTKCTFTDHSTETQHTDLNTTLKHKTGTQTNHAFTDHNIETQHTDSNSALKHNTQTSSNGNKLEIVVNQMNLNTNLDLSRVY